MDEVKLPQGWYQKIAQDEINLMPLGKWDGATRLVSTDAGLQEAALAWQNQTLLGFDTETRPTFRKGVIYAPSLIQLALDNEVQLIQLQGIKDHAPLGKLFSNSAIRKVGVGLEQDIRKLQGVFSFNPNGFLDLASVAERLGLPNRGLRSMAAAHLRLRISKRAKCSNWAKEELKPFQIVYAATDAWIGRELYRTFEEYGVI
ncbi:MAG: 3'-5' exonuclease domain-containing protein 2 [Magnetococcales bacterium]|nr:3'-5' exonuclease domain-containing protein 2 [Magnetococcales bacterium]NGZ26148.1 3'-5' exonuclease domain-containing protein 2 [Magnetococcales bacterium]